MIWGWWRSWISMAVGLARKWRVCTLLALLFVVVYTFFGTRMGVHSKYPQLSQLVKYRQFNATIGQLTRHWSFLGVKPALLGISETSSDNHVDGGQVSYSMADFSDTLKQTGVDFWKSIQPGFTCPKELVSEVGKGAYSKWTCGLATLGKRSLNSTPCVVYSFGVGEDSSFEAEVLEKTSCAIYAYDPTVNGMGDPLGKKLEPRVHFQKLGIEGANSETLRTLKTLMQQNGHEWIDIVKMDAELAEFGALNRAMKDFPNVVGNKSSGIPFGQLLVEVHVWEWHNPKNESVSREKAEMLVDFFERLERWGLRMFYLDINPFGGGHCCSEFSFLNINPQSLKRFIGNIGDITEPQ